MTSEQPELPLEWPEGKYDHYTVEIRRGPQNAEETVRSHTAYTVDDALRFIESLRDTFNQRADVAWKTEEVNDHGTMYGLAPGGEVYVIQVTPPLSVELS
jgi:hypothetical protein